MKTYFYRIFALISTFLCSFFSISQQVQISISPATNNQTFTTCDGFIIDSGGQGGSGYTINESNVVTICPSNSGDKITVVFSLFNLDETDDDPSPSITNVDHMTVYDGSSTSANSLGTYMGDELSGVTIMATELNVSGCLTFQFVSNSVGIGSFAGSAICATPCDDPVAGGGIVGGFTSDSIHVCVGEIVDFQNQGSYAQSGFNLTSYYWEFMDGTNSDLENPSHAFSSPGLYNVQLFVKDDNNCESNNYLTLQVVVAPEPDFSTFPSDTVLCLGESVSFTAIPNDYEVSINSISNSILVSNGCITDSQLGVTQYVDLLQNSFEPGTIITDVDQIESICFELEHSFMGDLVIQLSCPNGQSVILHQQGGGGTQIGIPNPVDGIDCSDTSTIGTPYSYCFTSTATNTWVEWVSAQSDWSLTLPSGEYEPIDPLTNLVGCPANGVWTLGITDNWAADDGCVFSFTLNLDSTLNSENISIDPQIGEGVDSSYWSANGSYINTISSNGDVVSITPTEPGTYNYQYFVIDDFGCTHDTSVNVTVFAIPSVFAGSDTTVSCWEQLQMYPQVSGINMNPSCEYTIVLKDIFGDGWTGNTVTIDNNGTLSTYTLQSGLSTSISFPVVNGDNLDVTFNAIGTFTTECSYTVFDSEGDTVFHQTYNLIADTTTTFVANCSEYSYSWTSDNPNAQISSSTIQNPIISTDSLTTFILSVYPTMNPSCLVTDTIVVNVTPTPAIPQIMAVGSSTFCEGDTLVLTSTYATAYLWSTGETTQSINVTESGNYSVTVFSPQGLSATSAVTNVAVNPNPIISISGDTIACEGDIITLIASGADSYSWLGGPNEAIFSFEAFMSTPCLVTGTLNSCSTSAIQLVTVNSLPSNPVITESSNMLSSTYASTYQWYVGGVEINGATSQDYTPTTTGVYSVMITDNNGCTATSDDFNYTLVGLMAIEHSNSFMVTPNPSTGKFHITFDNPNINHVKVLNAAGSVIYSSNTLNSEIDLTSHSKGIYFLKIETDDKMYVRKLIVN